MKQEKSDGGPGVRELRFKEELAREMLQSPKYMAGTGGGAAGGGAGTRAAAGDRCCSQTADTDWRQSGTYLLL